MDVCNFVLFLLDLNVSILFMTGSSQDGARSERQAGGSGETTEGGSGKGVWACSLGVFFVLLEIISPHLVLLKFHYISQTVFKLQLSFSWKKILIMSLFSLRPTPRSMSCRLRWRRSRRWCWRRRLPHRTASCTLSCSLRETGERTNTEAATSGTRARAAPFHPR